VSPAIDPSDAGLVVLDDEGWVSSATDPVERVSSHNQDARPDGIAPTLIVVHNISLPPGVFGGRAIDALFTNRLDPAEHPYYEGLRDLRVSSHFLIRRDGALVQYVACGRRAWHAGVSSFRGRERCNDFSIGIELEGDDLGPFEAVQYARLIALTHALLRHYPIDAIAGHSEIAPGRKTDPGPFFSWPTLMATLSPTLRMPVDAAP
jgi:AmpD protein